MYKAAFKLVGLNLGSSGNTWVVEFSEFNFY